MKISARSFVVLVLATALPAAHAQTGKWPEKPVRIIVASPPGSGDDFVTRVVATKLSELLGQQFIAENRPGAGGMIGQVSVQKSPPDGYTWLLAGGSMAGARLVNANVAYDVLRDFTPVSLLETSSFFMVVHPSVPAKNLKEFIALARARPGNMTFGTPGAGQMPYWNALLFNSMARIQSVEVPYKSLSETIIDVMAGRIDYYFAPAVQYASSQTRLRALGVTGPARSPAFPDVPPIGETVPGYDLPAWRSIMGPAGVRRDIVDSLNAAIRRTLAMPDIRDKMLAAGHEPQPSSPEELSNRYTAWIAIFTKVAKEAGLKPQ